MRKKNEIRKRRRGSKKSGEMRDGMWSTQQSKTFAITELQTSRRRRAALQEFAMTKPVRVLPKNRRCKSTARGIAGRSLSPNSRRRGDAVRRYRSLR